MVLELASLETWRPLSQRYALHRGHFEDLNQSEKNTIHAQCNINSGRILLSSNKKRKMLQLQTLNEIMSIKAVPSAKVAMRQALGKYV
jgi:hypothetical protein